LYREKEVGVSAACYSLAAQAKADLRQSSNTLLIRRGVDSGRKAATRKEVDRACGQCVTLLSRPGGYGPAPNPSNTLLIRRGVDSERQAVIEEGGWSACRQCVTLLSRPGIGEPALDPSNTLLFIKALIQGGRLQRGRR
jgi:hypothetical protein